MRISGDFFASKTQIEAGNPQAADPPTACCPGTPGFPQASGAG